MNLSSYQDTFLILVKLILAHIATDFMLQPNSWVKNRNTFKWKSPSLYIHSFLAGLTTYLIIMRWDSILIPLFIIITHLGIDSWKSYQKNTPFIFFLDQAFHVIILFCAWIFYTGTTPVFDFFQHTIALNYKGWIIIAGYAIVIWPCGYIIAQITGKWQQELTTDNEGLTQAGKWIGRLERILILTFVMMNQYFAIGFLIAAKSVFRFGEIKNSNDRKMAEYILIGTLLSFTFAILLGIITKSLLTLS